MRAIRIDRNDPQGGRWMCRVCFARLSVRFAAEQHCEDKKLGSKKLEEKMKKFRAEHGDLPLFLKFGDDFVSADEYLEYLKEENLE